MNDAIIDSPHAVNGDRLTEAEHKINVLAWLYAELLYNAKLNAAKQLLANPQLREALAAKLAQGG